MPTTTTTNKLRRLSAAAGLRRGAVDRKAKTISGVAVVTAGEALTHERWIDARFLQEVVDPGNAAPGGVKSRYTHPKLSSDNFGKMLGRLKDFRLDGNVVRADLHLAEASFSSPHGNLGKYVMDLAEEDPKAFGLSIVFSSDAEKEQMFAAKWTGDDGKFKSPDENNTANLPHWRLSELGAADVEDTVAANPDGFLGAFDKLAQLEEGLDFLLEVPGAESPPAILGDRPKHAKKFVRDYLSRRELAVVASGDKEKQEVSEMSDEKKALSPDEFALANPDGAKVLRAMGAEQAREELSKMNEAFGDNPAFVLSAFLSGQSMADATADYWKARAEKAEAEKEELAAKPPVALEGEQKVVMLATGDADGVDLGKGDFLQQAQALAAETNCSVTDAMTQLEKTKPALYRAYREANGIPV